LEIVQGGFFLRKKPLGIQVSVKSRIENAVMPGSSAVGVRGLPGLKRKTWETKFKMEAIRLPASCP
jgi:hypothetical protein